MNSTSLHSLVIGSGIGGLSAAVLLARAGRRVTLLESQPVIGGRLRRFRRQGIPFDTGFHFTSSLDGDGILGQMLSALGIREGLTATPFPWSLRLSDGHQLVFPNHGRDVHFDYLAKEFPEQADALRKYQAIETEVLQHTPMFDLHLEVGDPMQAYSEYDQLSLKDLFARVGISGGLATALASPALYHGSPPSDVPAARHFRVSYGFEEEMVRMEHGGDPLVKGFTKQLSALGIEVRTACRVLRFRDFNEFGQCHGAELSNGELLAFDDLFLSIHPALLPELLPEEHRRGFQRLVEPLKNTCGFFTVFATIPNDCPMQPHLDSVLRDDNLDRVLRPENGDALLSTGFALTHDALADGRPVQSLILLSPAVAPPMGRAPTPEEKQAMTSTVVEHTLAAFPQLRGHLTVLDSASPYTYARYVPPGYGAYGIRMAVDNPRLMGRLPIRNFYGIGECAFTPGIIGTLLSSFLVVRRVIGESAYQALL